MLYAIDAVVNQAAKWSHMVGGQASPGVTIRAIINRGGEQGAQHSQALHAWFAHIPGLRVVMPATVADARDLLIASVLCRDPVMFIDDRWLYDLEDELPPVVERDLAAERPLCLARGDDLTIVGSGYSTRLALEASRELQGAGVSAEVIDLRVLNPFYPKLMVESVARTGRLLVVDGGWSPCGMAGEVIASVVERSPVGALKKPPVRVTLPDAPAPTSRVLESAYYPTVATVVAAARSLMG
jgi:pyruvate dehydrogenase E1 component beta subunit